MSTPGGLFSYKASLSRGDQRHVRAGRRLKPKRVCLAAHPFGSRKWRSGLNGICHPDWVKFGVELNSTPKQKWDFPLLYNCNLWVSKGLNRSVVKLFLLDRNTWYHISNVSRGWPEGSLFHSYYIEVQGRALLLSPDHSTLILIRTLYCWVLSKAVSSTIFKVFGMTRPGIEPRSAGSLANTLPTRPMSRLKLHKNYKYKHTMYAIL